MEAQEKHFQESQGEAGLHCCYSEEHESLKGAGYGWAVLCCFEDEKSVLWVDNYEYCNSVNYCPFCGYKSKSTL